MSTAETKKQLRNTVRKEIATLSGDYIERSNAGILIGLLSLDEYKKAKNIMLYHSIDREPDTIAIANAALKDGKTVAFPYCYPGGKMEARIVDNLHDFTPALLGIPAPPDHAPVIAPHELDLIVVPALIFDKSGYRLGYGGGYYDRYLADIPAYTIGITRHKLLRDEVPKEQHDVAVNCLITEESIFAKQ